MAHREEPSWLDRGLRVFADVRAGEGFIALLLALNVFLILMAYYVLKPVREALVLGEGSAELKSYLSAGQVVLLAFVVPFYGRLVSRLPRMTLINTVTLFFIACPVIFYVLNKFGVPLAIIFFIWIGIFSLMVIAQFWSFAADIYTKEEGERLFPIVGFGASLGAVFGARIADHLIEPVGVYELMLVGGAILLGQLALTNYINGHRAQRTVAPKASAAAAPAPPKASGANAFALVFRTRYLILMALMLMMLNWVNSTGEYILGRIVTDAAQRMISEGRAAGLTQGQIIGDFYSKYFTLVNGLGLLLQLFVVSRVVKRFGIPIAVMILPVTFAHRLQRDALPPVPVGGAQREGVRERDRLLVEQHGAEHALPPLHARGEVQRQAGDRLVLLPGWRCAVRGDRVRRHGRAVARDEGLRAHQRRARGGLGRAGVAGGPHLPRHHVDGACSRNRTARTSGRLTRPRDPRGPGG